MLAVGTALSPTFSFFFPLSDNISVPLDCGLHGSDLRLIEGSDLNYDRLEAINSALLEK